MLQLSGLHIKDCSRTSGRLLRERENIRSQGDNKASPEMSKEKGTRTILPSFIPGFERSCKVHRFWTRPFVHQRRFNTNTFNARHPCCAEPGALLPTIISSLALVMVRVHERLSGSKSSLESDATLFLERPRSFVDNWNDEAFACIQSRYRMHECIVSSAYSPSAHDACASLIVS